MSSVPNSTQNMRHTLEIRRGGGCVACCLLLSTSAVTGRPRGGPLTFVFFPPRILKIMCRGPQNSSWPKNRKKAKSLFCLQHMKEQKTLIEKLIQIDASPTCTGRFYYNTATAGFRRALLFM